jgi:hypothetical protein
MIHVNFYQEQFKITLINNNEAQYNHKIWREHIDKKLKQPNQINREKPRDFSINFPFHSLGGSIDYY